MVHQFTQMFRYKSIELYCYVVKFCGTTKHQSFRILTRSFYPVWIKGPKPPWKWKKNVTLLKTTSAWEMRNPNLRGSAFVLLPPAYFWKQEVTCWHESTKKETILLWKCCCRYIGDIFHAHQIHKSRDIFSIYVHDTTTDVRTVTLSQVWDGGMPLKWIVRVVVPGLHSRSSRKEFSSQSDSFMAFFHELSQVSRSVNVYKVW